MNENADIIKMHACPACGAENVMRFRGYGTSMVAPCSKCGAAVELKQAERADENQPLSAFDDPPEWSHSVRHERAAAESDVWYQD